MGLTLVGAVFLGLGIYTLSIGVGGIAAPVLILLALTCFVARFLQLRQHRRS